jgi:membrane fusion protein (multidrug efflux system)
MIDGGLKAGDRVVVNGLMTIGPGAPVTAVPWKSTAVPAADPVPPTPKQG